MSEMTREHLEAVRDMRALPLKIVQIKAEAGRLGMFRTMHALEAATQAVGYELADIIDERTAAMIEAKLEEKL